VTNHRPFRFGVQTTGASNLTEWRNLAKSVEDSGYSVMLMPDHLDNQFAPLPALAVAAQATTSLRLGQLVLSNDYRHPVMLAKELATLDVLSGGRLEIGLGAGHVGQEYALAGMSFDSPKVRVDRLIEGIRVIRGLLAPGAFSFAGKHYTVDGIEGWPRPVQDSVPLLIGGGGPRMLRFAATEADIVGINLTTGVGQRSPTWQSSNEAEAPPVGSPYASTMTPTAVDEKGALVQDAAGVRRGQLELNIRAYMTCIRPDADEALNEVARRLELPPEFVADSPFALVGPPTKLVDDLLARRERWGLSYVVVAAADVEAFAPVVATLTS
jgi:probable F420-dependent oxidoreductase